VEELYISKYNLLCWEAQIFYFFWSDGPIKLACCKKKIELGKHLI
jgi:hypothetical protein